MNLHIIMHEHVRTSCCGETDLNWKMDFPEKDNKKFLAHDQNVVISQSHHLLCSVVITAEFNLFGQKKHGRQKKTFLRKVESGKVFSSLPTSLHWWIKLRNVGKFKEN